MRKLVRPVGLVLAGCLLLAGSITACTSDGDDAAETAETTETDVYALAGSCRSLVDRSSGDAVGADGDRWAADADGRGVAFRMQATALGRFLLYGPEGEMIAAGSDDRVVATTTPGPAADWTIEAVGEDLALTNLKTGQELGLADDQTLVQDDGQQATWDLVDATGCADFPDIDPGASGDPFVGPSPDAPVEGFLDAHTHISAFRFLGGKFHCGRPWSPYGVTVALADCADHEDGGIGATTESLLSSGDLGGSHATSGWPAFEGWPKPGSLTHEGTYWRWIERAWRGGLRLVVNHLVDNRALCEIYPLGTDDACNDMDSVARQAKDMIALQDYIDAQFGGPGTGFFRVVTSPQQAREVINDGKLAVVLGVEASEVFDCGRDGEVARCDEDQIDAGIDELHELGVRTVFPVHKFDNALGGTRYDPGIVGLLVNAGNRYATGEWWQPEPCPDGAEPDATVISPNGSLDTVAGTLVDVLGDTIAPILEGDLPTYAPGPHCNPRGLTDLGRHTIGALADRGMIVETDHLSARARSEALDILADRGYPGLISSHGHDDPSSQVRLQELGGVVSPYASTLPGFVDSWREAKETAPDEFHFGLGYGSDTNGLGAQPSPRADNDDDPVTYPYRSFDGGTVMDQQVSGTKTFDVNVDGVAHFGLFPDWIEDLRTIAGPEIVDDLVQGAEAYLQMWERTVAEG